MESCFCNLDLISVSFRLIFQLPHHRMDLPFFVVFSNDFELFLEQICFMENVILKNVNFNLILLVLRLLRMIKQQSNGPEIIDQIYDKRYIPFINGNWKNEHAANNLQEQDLERILEGQYIVLKVFLP